MKNIAIRGMTTDHNIRFLAVDSKQLVEEARIIHQTSPVSTAALGRTLTAGVLLGKQLKEPQDKLTLHIKGSNLIKSIVVTTDHTGNVKGYISDPMVDLPIREDGKLDVGGAIGIDGKLMIIKDFGMKEPFIGQIDLVTGEIAEDLAAYFMHSEQLPSVVSLGVYLNEDGTVGASGGLIIQLMPDCPEESIVKLEAAVERMETITTMLRRGMTLVEVVADCLSGFEIEVFDTDEVAFVCDCNRERIEKALISIGQTDLQMIIDEDEKAEVNCHFCNKHYHFDKAELELLLKEARGFNRAEYEESGQLEELDMEKEAIEIVKE